MKRPLLLRFVLLGLAAPLMTCGDESSSPIILATTTSVEDTGLLEQLLPAFHEAHPGMTAQAVAAGTGLSPV